MDSSALLGLIRRQWLTLIVITLAVVLATGALVSLKTLRHETTLLFAVGVAAETTTEKSFDTTKLADDFAHTIAGWARSPALAEKASNLAATPISLAAAPQAKQNFLVTIGYTDPAAADRITAAVRQVFDAELAKYNLNSKFQFFISLHGESRALGEREYPPALAAGLVGGLLLALAEIILSAYLGGRVNSTEEAEKILAAAAIGVSKSLRNDDLKFVAALLDQLGSHALLVGADANLKKLVGRLDSHANVKTAALPNDAALLTKNDATPVVVVQLDKTRVRTLHQIRSLIGDRDTKLVVWG